MFLTVAFPSIRGSDQTLGSLGPMIGDLENPGALPLQAEGALDIWLIQTFYLWSLIQTLVTLVTVKSAMW